VRALALGIFALSTLAGSFTETQQTYCAENTQEYSAPHQGTGERTPIEFAAIADAVQPRSAKESDNNPQQQERWWDKAWRHWVRRFFADAKITDAVVAISTVFLAIFTYRLWVSTNHMWEATKRSADAARDSADVLPAIERPYVLVIGGGFLTVSTQVTQDSRPIVAYRCGNFGKTPAIIENLRAGFSRNSDGRPDPPNRVEDTHALLLARILKDGEEISPLWVFCPDDWVTGDVAVNRGESMLLVRQPTTTEGEELFLRIIVNYRGAFTKGHETSACWKFSFSEHMFLHYGGDEYNYER
jgi:hypothetical protein